VGSPHPSEMVGLAAGRPRASEIPAAVSVGASRGPSKGEALYKVKLRLHRNWAFFSNE